MEQHEDGSVTLTREELYLQVWSTPMRRLARQYDLSDVGLAKLCKKHKIPRPPVGYWAKKEAGKKVQQPSLPTVSDPAIMMITIRGPSDGADQAHSSETRQRIDAERHPANAVTVNNRLDSPHALVARTLRSLRTATPDERGLVRSGDQKTLHVSVGTENIERAIRILDALIRAFEHRSFRMATDPQNKKRLCVFVNDEPVEFVLFERLKQHAREMTPEERRERFWSTSGMVYTYHLTGRLTLQILDYRGDFARRSWTDGKKQRLEKCLNDFITSILETSDAIKRQRQERDEARRKHEAWERERAERLRLIQEEEKRLARLEAEVTNWHRSQRIRKYAEAVRAAAADAGSDVRDDGELARWLEWAFAQADRLDPLVKSPPSILDEKHKWESSCFGSPYPSQREDRSPWA